MKRLLLGLGLALAAACADPTIPDRTDSYGFDDSFGDVFRWPSDRLPVRFYADDRGPMRKLVVRSIAIWEQQFLYEELRGALVSDSNAADVIVRWGGAVPPDVEPDDRIPTFYCSGLTQILIDSTGSAIEGPIHITVDELTMSTDPPLLVACYARVVSHELGHSIGLLQHSTQSGDLMSAQPLLGRPTTRDRVTVEVLYHTTPTIGPPPR